MPRVLVMDDQPISATFFGEGKWLTEFITPDALDIEELHEELTHGKPTVEDRIASIHQWVANEIKYKRLITGHITIEGRTSVQTDLWNSPAVTARVKVGNCANKSFLLTSLLRKELSPNNVHCVLGNLYNGKAGGHAWTQVNLGGQDYIVESTRGDVPSLVPTATADRYEAVHFFNDKSTYAVEGRTVLEPFTKCFSSWLSEYLDWAYIEGGKVYG